MCSTGIYYSTSKRFFQALQSILIYFSTVACACPPTSRLYERKITRTSSPRDFVRLTNPKDEKKHSARSASSGLVCSVYVANTNYARLDIWTLFHGNLMLCINIRSLAAYERARRALCGECEPIFALSSDLQNKHIIAMNLHVLHARVGSMSVRVTNPKDEKMHSARSASSGLVTRTGIEPMLQP